MGKKARSSDEKAMIEWEGRNILPYKIKKAMKTMWEIPQIFHFLHLTKESLGLPNLSMYELERMFLVPQASKQMAQIMTSLLSHVGMNKAKLKKMPPMPFEFWTNILAYKLKNWFKVYDAKKGDAIKVLESIGVEPQFWTVFPDPVLAKGKNFEDLTLLQRIWLVKTVCDTLMHSRKAVQDEIAKQPWESLFETVLGTDRDGAKYVYFPQFLKSDLRIYRHCLDNTILSTVKPKKERKKPVVSPKKIDRTSCQRGHLTKRYTRWRNGLPVLSKKSKVRNMQNRLNRLNKNKSKAGSLVNRDTNLSSTSGCGNNNNSSNDNDNTNLDIMNGKKSRRSSHCSEASMESDKVHCESTESSIYDANSSVGTTSAQQASQKMFQGFSSTSDDKRNIEETNGLFQMETDNRDMPLVHNSQNQIKLVSVNNLCSISKTDDEKLNEIISAECLKLTGKGSSNFQLSTISKSDDEKLNETRTSRNGTEEDNVSFIKEKRENGIVTENGQSVEERVDLDNDSNDTEVESSDENFYLKELRIMLRKDAMEDHCSADEDTEMGHSEETNDRGQESEGFYKMLLDLGVSKFQLVADSVSSLRDLISTFKADSGDTNGANSESVPLCELQLIKNLTELLSTVEKIEPALVESTKNARAKLRKEWTDHKESSVENQDSSREGHNSNWWVIGSQGCPLPEDETPRTLPQCTLPSVDTQEKTEGDSMEQGEDAKCDPESESHQSKDKRCERKGTQSEEGEEGSAHTVNEGKEGHEEETNEEEASEGTNEEEQQTRRVLRARGISSYTEQLYSDEDNEENDLGEWTDVEGIYADPSAEATVSAAYLTPKVKQSDERTNEEDSDQEWILPSSRRRKNKRPSANRRLKSFQHKLQSIKVDELREAAESVVVSAAVNSEHETEEPKIKDVETCEQGIPLEPKDSNADSTKENQEALAENDSEKTTVPSRETGCKVENIESVHSELDIKDEGPIYDSTSSQFDSNYAANINPNYIMVKQDHSPMSYYVMQPNHAAVVSQNAIVQPSSVVPNVMQPFQQGYYLQGEQNYIIQTPQPSFIPPQTFQSQGPQMVAPQQFVNHPGYMPYMTTAPQPGFVATNPQFVAQGVPQPSTVPVQYNPVMPPRFVQNRCPVPRQNHPHPSGAVIRSNVPVRGNFPRNSNVRMSRNSPQQRGTPAKAPKLRNQGKTSENAGQKTTLIVLSDSDDEIEMIITEKTGTETDANRAKNKFPRNTNAQAKQKTPSNANTSRNAISPQIIQRMSQGGISITPVRPPQPVQASNTQLVVVVNETGSHYALSLPNGSKLILTPEQVAQIRASNGGKLIL